MSYARLSDMSDCYVYLSDTALNCCGSCDSLQTRTTQEMIDHLQDKAQHPNPDPDVVDRLRAAASYNDPFLAGEITSDEWEDRFAVESDDWTSPRYNVTENPPPHLDGDVGMAPSQYIAFIGFSLVDGE
jgi:hypothetical protein